MDLTNPLIKTEVQKIYDMFFQQNSILDNVANAIDIEFNMPSFSDFVHLHISHKMPLIADFITDFAKLRGTRIGRGALNSNLNNFDSVYTSLKESLDYQMAIEREISKTIDLCIDLDHKPFEDFFRDFQNTYVIPYTHQISKFMDGVKKYDEDGTLPSFNKDFGSFITLMSKKDWHNLQFD